MLKSIYLRPQIIYIQIKQVNILLMKKIIFSLSVIIGLAACGGGDTADTTETSGTAPKSMIEQSAANSPEGIALKSLMAQSDCAACHQIDAASIGPSYVDVANKYPNNDETIQYLADKILNGGSGVWGNVPMAAHPNMKHDEAETLAKDIMALKKS